MKFLFLVVAAISSFSAFAMNNVLSQYKCSGEEGVAVITELANETIKIDLSKYGSQNHWSAPNSESFTDLLNTNDKLEDYIDGDSIYIIATFENIIYLPKKSLRSDLTKKSYTNNSKVLKLKAKDEDWTTYKVSLDLDKENLTLKLKEKVKSTFDLFYETTHSQQLGCTLLKEVVN